MNKVLLRLVSAFLPVLLFVSCDFLGLGSSGGSDSERSNSRELTAFSIINLSESVVIEGTNISVKVSQGTDLTSLVATFSTTGSSVEIGGVAQHSGVTANDFTNPVTYRVTAEDGSVTDYTVMVSAVNIYVSGYISNGTYNVPVYWKNGLMKDCSSGETHDMYGNKMFIDNEDVYLAGYENDGVYKARYWKNGVKFNLSDNATGSAAYAIKVSGNDVYAAGYDYKGTENAAAYWKNGELNYLTDGSLDSLANDITVIGSDVYIAGYEDNGSGKNRAAYWKNGVINYLTDGTYNADALALFVSGSDVYVAGYESNGSFDVARYWKNGTPVSLSDGTETTRLYSLFVKDQDVYAAGSSSKALYWKNETLVSELTDGTYQCGANSIYVANDDVYVAGDVSNGTLLGATYWKNDVPVYLTDRHYASVIYSIIVQ